jgi:hypothetical protein
VAKQQPVTDEEIQRAARAIARVVADRGKLPGSWTVEQYAGTSYAQDFARAVIEADRAALAEAGRLLPPDGYRKIFSTWYRSLDLDGQLWCESSDPTEIRRRSKPGFTLQKLEIFEVNAGWVAWVPVGEEETPDGQRG